MSDNFMRKTPGAPAGDAIGWIEITPKGIKRLGRNPFDQIGKIAVFAKQAAYLAGWTMTERTFGRFLGAAWIVLDPTLQAIVLFLTLSWIFNIRGDDVSFLSIYLSVTLWRPTLNLVTIAPALLVSRATILQQTNFPVLLILLETVIYELYLVGLNFIIVAILLLFAGKLNPLWGLLPFTFSVQILFTLALMILLMRIGTVVRDTAPIVSVIMNIVFYASPIVYGMERIGEPYRTVLYWINPLTHIMPAHRDIMVNGNLPPLLPLVVITIVSLVVIMLQLRTLESARHRFYQFL
jgi:ABC-type polysaccharide/polyol phosphate export permease